MNKEKLEELINKGMSLNKISKDLNKSLTTIRYWVKKYGIEVKFKNFKEIEIKDYGKFRFCPRCKNDCPIENFYNRRGKNNSSVYCKKCTSDQSLERMRDLKTEMVNYKGNCCSICGYNKYIGALEFHHLNPQEKDFAPSQLKSYKFDDVVKKELDKCILVCSNCHREIHDKIRKS